MKRTHLVRLAAFFLILVCSPSTLQPFAWGNDSASGDTQIGRAFRTQASDIQVEGEGIVTRVLADDLAGSRHQRLIVRLASGQTVLIAHNIDIAPRVVGLQKGDPVRFCGEYVWNDQGGIVHWTHHDPQGRHAAGWLKHNGQTYQ